MSIENTKENELAKSLNIYIKERHNQDECIGFIDGFNTGYDSQQQKIDQLEREVEELKKHKTHLNNTISTQAKQLKQSTEILGDVKSNLRASEDLRKQELNKNTVISNWLVEYKEENQQLKERNKELINGIVKFSKTWENDSLKPVGLTKLLSLTKN